MSKTSTTHAADEWSPTLVQAQSEGSAKNPGSNSGPAAGPDTNGSDNEERHRKIAIAAYYRAERRGFEPGGQFDDWLAAEAEIEQQERAQRA